MSYPDPMWGIRSRLPTVNTRQYSNSHGVEMAHVIEVKHVELPVGLNVSKPKANDRRQAAKCMCGDWFTDHGLELGRDYFIDFKFDWYARHRATVVVVFRDATPAILFKLAWVNV